MTLYSIVYAVFIHLLPDFVVKCFSSPVSAIPDSRMVKGAEGGYTGKKEF